MNSKRKPKSISESSDPSRSMWSDFLIFRNSKSDVAVNRASGDFPEHLHEFAELGFRLAGRATHRIDGFEHVVEEGSFVMAAPGASHSYRAGGRDFKRLNVQVRRQCLERLLAEMREPGLELAPFDGRFAEFARKRKGGPVLDPTTFEAAVRIVSEMEGEWLEPKPGFAAKLRFMLGELLMLLARTLASNAVPEQDDAKRRLRDAIALVGREYARPIKMDELEAVAGLGRRSLERAFLKETGLAPKAFILKTRVAWACRLLADRGMRIQEAAEACGFSEQNYFTRVFKAYTGMTPGQFAKRKGGT